MHARAALLTAALVAAALTACSDNSQGHAERAPHATAGKETRTQQTPDCGPDSTLSQSDWIDQCGDAATPTDNQPDTELAVGDAFTYDDGVKITVTSIRKLIRFGEWDSRPDADQTAYRVTWTVDNATKRPFDLENVYEQEQGASNGGEVDTLSVDNGSRTMTGRIAPGKTGTFTNEGAIDKTYGTDLVITFSRSDIGEDMLAEDPHWTGGIK
ncbi:hypothetical protein [Streptomyces sp. NPDC001530]|uniref:hypothetical protein n=1 Tax=Streptomyces sp. NPDC001530 TaxID=3364582 RepID=UPI0036BCE13C